MLEPVLVGWPVLREVVMNALAARGHLVLCELGDVRFFVDPRDRVVGAWLMWHGGWQRREIDAAVEVLPTAGRLQSGAVFIDIGAHIGTHTVYALRTGRFDRAVAFEPEPRNARLLAMNLEVNGLSRTGRHRAQGGRRRDGHGDAASAPAQHRRSRDRRAAVDRRATRCARRAGGARRRRARAPRVPLEMVGLVWVDVEGYEPQVLDGLANLMARSVPLTFEFTPSRYGAELKQHLVDLLARHYTTVHSLGRRDPSAPIGTLASRTHTDDVLVY